MRLTVIAMLVLSALVIMQWGTAGSAPPSVVAEATVSESTADGRRTTTYGIVRFEDGPHGLIIKPKLHGLDPGPHAAHVHENPDCAPDGMGIPAGAAGGHYDPEGTGVHTGPWGDGHLGDLPNLMAEQNGLATLPVVAPRITVADLKGRSLMIHAGPDRYEDYGEHVHREGGPRMYCGVIR